MTAERKALIALAERIDKMLVTNRDSFPYSELVRRVLAEEDARLTAGTGEER